MASSGAVQQNRLVCSQGNACLACNAGILGHATNDAQACRTSSVLASSFGGWKARELHQGEERKSSGMSLTTNTHGLRLHCTQFTMCRQHHDPLPSIQTKGCHSPAVPAHHAALVAVLDCLLGHVPAGGNHKAQQHHWLAGACKLFQSTPIAVAQLVPTASGSPNPCHRAHCLVKKTWVACYARTAARVPARCRSHLCGSQYPGLAPWQA